LPNGTVTDRQLPGEPAPFRPSARQSSWESKDFQAETTVAAEGGAETRLFESEFWRSVTHPTICPVWAIDLIGHAPERHCIMEREETSLFHVLYASSDEAYRAPATGAEFDAEHVNMAIFGMACSIALIHKRGFLHRDLKPANMFSGCGSARQIDGLRVVDSN
jgi:serine/threonine protein kinase